MSTIPINSMRSVTDPIVPVWNEPFTLNEANRTLRIDTLTRYKAFWQKAILRNYGSLPMKYRTLRTAPYQFLPTAADRTLDGWGSYLEVELQGIAAAGATVEAIVTVYMCRREDVYVQR